MTNVFEISHEVTIVVANNYPVFAHNKCYRDNELTTKQMETEIKLKKYEVHYDLMIKYGDKEKSWAGKFSLAKALDYLMDDEPDNELYTYGLGRIEHELEKLCLSEGTHKSIDCFKEINDYFSERPVLEKRVKSTLKKRLTKRIAHSNSIRVAILADKAIKKLNLR